MKYRRFGNTTGPLIVFINGAATGPWIWNEVVQYLGDYHILLFDLPGHGENSDVDFISIEQVARHVVDWIKVLSPEHKGAVVGLSIGAQTVAHMMKHYSDYIIHGFIVSGLNKKSVTFAKIASWMIGISMPLVKYRWFAKAQSRSLNIPEDMFELYYRDSLLMSRTSLTNILVENQMFELVKPLDVGQKVTIMVGENEIGMMHDSAKTFVSVFGVSAYYSFKNCGHGIPYEAPKALSDLLRTVLGGGDLVASSAYEILKI